MKKIKCFFVLCLFLCCWMKAQELIPYCKNGKYGYANLSRELLIAPNFEKADLFRNGKAIVKQDGIYALIDSKGTKLTTAPYAHLKWETGDFYSVELKEKVGVMNSNTKIIVPVSFDHVEFLNHVIVGSYENGKEIMYSFNGKKMLTSDTAFIVSENDEDSIYSVTYVQNKQAYSIIYSNLGKQLYGPVPGTLQIRDIETMGLYIVDNVDIIKHTTNSSGLMDETGSWIIQPMRVMEEASFEIGKDKYKDDEFLDKVYAERKSNPSAYTYFLKENYIGFTLPDSILKLYSLEGQEIVKLLLRKSGICIYYNGGKVESTWQPGEKGGDIDFEDDNYIAIDLMDTITSKNYTYLFNKKWELLNKEAFNSYRALDDIYKQLNIIYFKRDNLVGLMHSNGKEYISCKYLAIDVQMDSTIKLTRTDGKMALIKFPKTEASIDEEQWYDDITNTKLDLSIALRKENGMDKLGLLRNNGEVVLSPSYAHCKVLDNVFFVSSTNNNTASKIVNDDGEIVSIDTKYQLAANINFSKKQFILKEGNNFYYQNGENITLLTAFKTAENGVLWSHYPYNNAYYACFIINDKFVAYKIENDKISQTIPATTFNPTCESQYGMEVILKDKKTKLIGLDAKDLVPAGEWKQITESIIYDYKNKITKGWVYIANGEKYSAVYSSKGEAIFKCQNCTIGSSDGMFIQDEYIFTVESNMENKPFNFFYLFSSKNNKIVPIPMSNESFENLTDTSYFLVDTSGKSYIYYQPQSQLIKIPFNCTQKLPIDIENETITYYIDDKKQVHFYDTKNGEFKKLPGYFSEFFSIYDTYGKNPHSYFYYYSDSLFTKRGIIDEKGKILLIAEYQTIQMPTDNEDIALFTADNNNKTDLITLKGALVSTGKKYTQTYFEDESILYGEWEENNKKKYHLFNTYNNYKHVNYVFNGVPGYARALKVGDKWIITFEKAIYEEVKKDGATELIDRSYILYLDQDGKEFFEFDKHFKDTLN